MALAGYKVIILVCNLFSAQDNIFFKFHLRLYVKHISTVACVGFFRAIFRFDRL